MSREINLSRKLKISRKILYARLLKKYMPLTVSWMITRRCNQHCLYCGISNVAKEELATKTIFAVIDELTSFGTERISFTGGEPLLRDDLGYIIDYARNKGVLSVVNTNGKLMKKLVHKISNVSRVTLSLDGPKQIHNKLRQDESYHEVIDAIKLCKSENITVVLTTVLSKYNLDYVDFIFNIANNFGIKVIFQPASLCTLGENEKNPVAPDLEKYRMVIKALINRKNAGDQRIYNSLAGLHHLYHWPEYTRISCWAGKLHCTIDCNGDIYPCGHTSPVLNESSINFSNLRSFNPISKISIDNCNQCWCASMVEFNLMLSFNVNALRNIVHMEL